MSPTRYVQIPTSHPTAEAEMEDAFASDIEEEEELQPMISPSRSQRSNIPLGAYDFEYDYPPPPGSPPEPSTVALPNSFGNSNGFVPPISSGPISSSTPQPRSRDWLIRRLGTILPTYYQRIPTSASAVRGGGLENDGVFANVTAKPGGPPGHRGAESAGDIHWTPEDTQKEPPPSYASAQADAVPPYWETTILAPSGVDGEILIDGLPAGSLLSFFSNLLISFSFQFVGFMLTSILSSTHAAKFGSRAGLGVTLIQYGFYLRTRQEVLTGQARGRIWPWETSDASSNSASNADKYNETSTYEEQFSSGDLASANEWLSFFLMTIGWFVFLTSCVGLFRVKRWERGIQSSSPAPSTTQNPEMDSPVRLSLHRALGLRSYVPAPADEERALRSEEARRLDERLQADLRAAGLL